MTAVALFRPRSVDLVDHEPLRQCVTRSAVRRRLTAYCRQYTRLDQLPGELVFESIVMSKGEEPPPEKVNLQHT